MKQPLKLANVCARVVLFDHVDTPYLSLSIPTFLCSDQANIETAEISVPHHMHKLIIGSNGRLVNSISQVSTYVRLLLTRGM